MSAASNPRQAFKITRLNDGRSFQVKGRCGQTAEALALAGSRGVTAQEMSSWALRLAAYVHDLIHKHHIPISMEPRIMTAVGMAAIA